MEIPTDAKFTQLYISNDPPTNIFSDSYAVIHDEYGRIDFETFNKAEGDNKMCYRILRALLVNEKCCCDYLTQRIAALEAKIDAMKVK
jgi:hypothetical protein